MNGLDKIRKGFFANCSAKEWYQWKIFCIQPSIILRCCKRMVRLLRVDLGFAIAIKITKSLIIFINILHGDLVITWLSLMSFCFLYHKWIEIYTKGNVNSR